MDEAEKSRREAINKAGKRYAEVLKEHAAKGKDHKKARIAAFEDYQKTVRGDTSKGNK